MPRYDSYLIRVWRGESGDDKRWTGKLEHLPRGQTHRFGSLDDLLAALRQLLMAEEAAGPTGDDPVVEGGPTIHT